MTTDAAPASVLRGRPADSFRQVVVSAALILVVPAVWYAVAVRLEDTDMPYEVAMWAIPVAYAAVAALVVAVRARDARRRAWALAAVGGYLALSLVPAILLGPSIDSDRLFDHRWLVEAASQVNSVLPLVAWGLARRHGRWWWAALVPAYALDRWSTPWVFDLVEVAPESMWGVGVWVLSMGVTVLGGAMCWLVDVLTTQPRARVSVAGWSHEHA